MKKENKNSQEIGIEEKNKMNFEQKYRDLLNVIYVKSVPVHRLGQVVGYFVHVKDLKKFK
jgi:hypothetical protein